LAEYLPSLDLLCLPSLGAVGAHPLSVRNLPSVNSYTQAMTRASQWKKWNNFHY